MYLLLMKRALFLLFKKDVLSGGKGLLSVLRLHNVLFPNNVFHVTKEKNVYPFIPLKF